VLSCRVVTGGNLPGWFYLLAGEAMGKTQPRRSPIRKSRTCARLPRHPRQASNTKSGWRPARVAPTDLCSPKQKCARCVPDRAAAFRLPPGLRITGVCPRDVPEPPSTANDRHQQPPANMKLARALNLRATHGNTLVMRSSLDSDEDQGAPGADDPEGRHPYHPGHVRDRGSWA